MSVKLDWNNLEPFIRSLPKDIQERIYYLAKKANETGKDEYTEMIIALLEAFNSKREVQDLIKRLK